MRFCTNNALSFLLSVGFSTVTLYASIALERAVASRKSGDAVQAGGALSRNHVRHLSAELEACLDSSAFTKKSQQIHSMIKCAHTSRYTLLNIAIILINTQPALMLPIHHHYHIPDNSRIHGL